MDWSMPRPVLNVVAGALALIAAGSFASGMISAPQRGRLPGEHGTTPGAAIQATEATPLAEGRIEGTPPPRELTEAERAELEAERKAKAEAEAAAELAAVAAAKMPEQADPAPAPSQPDRVGELLDNAAAPPAVEEPPH